MSARSLLIACSMCIAVVLCTALSSRLQALPTTLTYQGRLTDTSGSVPPDTAHQIFFRLYRTPAGGSMSWSESATVTPLAGLFTHSLGSTTAIPDSVLNSPLELYLEIQIGSTTLSPRTRLESVPFSRYSGGLSVELLNGRTVRTRLDSTAVTFADDSGRALLSLTPGATGDSTLIVADNAISAEEVLDEPGIAVSIGISPITLLTAVMSDLVTVEITAPSEGFIVLQGKCYVELRGTTGANVALIQIDQNEGGGSNFPYFSLAGLGGYANSQSSYFPVYVTRVYFVDTGTYTFRMEGRAQNALPAEAVSWDHVLTATFYATAYDAVRSLSFTPGAGMPVTRLRDPSGDTPAGSVWYYEDLRNRSRAGKRALTDPSLR